MDDATLKFRLAWSLRTFGPGLRTEGLCHHITKELDEIFDNPNDPEEWVDVILLGIDGLQRLLEVQGRSTEEVVPLIREKIFKNGRRKWPDWRTSTPGKGIQHIREEP